MIAILRTSEPSHPTLNPTVHPPAPRRPRPAVRAQPVRLPGAQPAVGRHFDRRESEPRQGLQLRLHLLPGRPPRAERNAVRRDRRPAGRAGTTLDLVTSGAIYDTDKFRDVPPDLRRLNDIAFSGDGEPTTYKNFDEIIAACADVKRSRMRTARSLQSASVIKLVLITNASMFHRPHVQRGLAILDANNGEIWAKLEAGTDEYYQLIERTPIPFRQILDNITAAARVRPLVIQSLFMRVNGEPPSHAELEAFCDRLNEITAAGGQLKLVQIYTVARRPAESFVTPLTDAEVDAIVALVQERTGLNAIALYGNADWQ